MNAENRITVVSGLPRSGTSLMMQMLEAGGFPILTDHHRKPDHDNPRGYYELERVKAIKDDHAWLADAQGKAFKLIYLLLYDLPSTGSYDVIFMERNMVEIVTSQNRMLERLGQKQAPIPDDRVAFTFMQEVEKVRQLLTAPPFCRVLYVDYNRLIQNPSPRVKDLLSFLGGSLDADKMLAAIQPSLYRQRHGK